MKNTPDPVIQYYGAGTTKNIIKIREELSILGAGPVN